MDTMSSALSSARSPPSRRVSVMARALVPRPRGPCGSGPLAGSSKGERSKSPGERGVVDELEYKTAIYALRHSIEAPARGRVGRRHKT